MNAQRSVLSVGSGGTHVDLLQNGGRDDVTPLMWYFVLIFCFRSSMENNALRSRSSYGTNPKPFERVFLSSCVRCLDDWLITASFEIFSLYKSLARFLTAFLDVFFPLLLFLDLAVVQKPGVLLVRVEFLLDVTWYV